MLNQTFTDLEVMLLDDGSTDPAVGAICGAAAARDDRVEWVRFPTTNEDRKKRCTYASNINWGAAHTTGEYITFLAGDDYYHLDRCERMVAKLKEGNDVVYGSQERPNANGRFVPPLATEVLKNAFNKVDMASMMQTRESFEKVGGFGDDYEFWGDADAHYWLRLAEAGYLFVPIDDPERYSDAKVYRDDSVQDRWNKGKTPWA